MTSALRRFLDDVSAGDDFTVAIEALLDAEVIPVVITDGEERVVLVNATACSRLGLPAREVVGRPFGLVWQERIEGREVRFEDVRQPVRSETGHVVGHLHLLRDRIEGDTAALESRVADLEQANADLKALETTRNHLLSNVSHELRTPLVTIIGYVEMIGGGELGQIPEEVAASLKVVLRNALRLSARIDDLLNLTRLQDEELQPFLEDVPLGVVIRSILAEYRLLLEEKDLEVIFQASDALPPARADRRLTTIAIENILKNAVKFSARGGRIEIRTETVDNRIRIVIRDEGAGIPPEHLSRVFEPFFQVDSSPTRAYGGIGVGLAIVRRIAEAHGGSIDLKSEVDRGTTVILELPAATGAAIPSD
jgi:signal transduction histidine kinase